MVSLLILDRSVVDSILTYAQMVHPREGILLLRGHVKPPKTVISEVVIPPRAVHGFGFANFSPHMLPIDRSIIGTAHSHPSGTLQPSVNDLNHYYGRIMIIIAHPYHSHHNIAAFNRKGLIVNYDIVDDDESKLGNSESHMLSE
jgi:proteasome lid subunit RPN8/RPN11